MNTSLPPTPPPVSPPGGSPESWPESASPRAAPPAKTSAGASHGGPTTQNVSLPPVRTMAEDLAAAAKGVFEPDVRAATGSPAVSATVSEQRKVLSAPARVVNLPSRGAPRPTSRMPRVVGLVLLAVVLGGGALVTVRFLAGRGSGTVADIVPAEAKAFISVRSDDPLAEPLRSRMVSAVGFLPADQLAGTTDVTFVLLPGPSASEPLTALLVRGKDTIDLSAAPELGVQPLAPRTLLITRSADLGRVTGLSGRTWGREAAFQRVMRTMPVGAPISLAMRGEAVAEFLQPYAPHGLSRTEDLVAAILPDGDGKTASVVIRTSTARGGERTPASEGTIALAAKVPASAILVLQRTRDVLSSFLAAEATAVPASLRAGMQSLQQQSDAFRPLLEMIEGPIVVAVLPTAVPGVRDVVLLLPLGERADPQPQLRALETAFAGFGSYLGGSAPADAQFLETIYAGVPVRYVNFGSSARAFDYAVTDGLLLLATSRESMHAVLDTVRGGAPALTTQSPFALFADTLSGPVWTFMQYDASLAAEISPALRPLHALLGGLLLRSAAAGELAGSLLLGDAPALSEPTTPGGAVPTPTPSDFPPSPGTPTRTP